jgi:hypothetical protein
VEYSLTDWGQALCPALDAVLRSVDLKKSLVDHRRQRRRRRGQLGRPLGVRTTTRPTHIGDASREIVLRSWAASTLASSRLSAGARGSRADVRCHLRRSGFRAVACRARQSRSRAVDRWGPARRCASRTLHGSARCVRTGRSRGPSIRLCSKDASFGHQILAVRTPFILSEEPRNVRFRRAMSGLACPALETIALLCAAFIAVRRLPVDGTT